MYLNDLVDEYELKLDDFTGSKFGDSQQVTVVGWSKRDKWNAKIYIVKCNICSSDVELFGDGYFHASKGNLLKGQLPCGCSRTKWTEDQWKIICRRKAAKLGYEFIGWSGEYTGNATKLLMSCSKHGVWNTGDITHLMTEQPRGCPICANESTGKLFSKPDEEVISSFFATGAFHPDTKFYRSNRLDKNGHKPFWYVECPECGVTSESNYTGLAKGCRSCDCSRHQQKQSYINLVKDNNNVIAIKFGIANLAKKRVIRQDAHSVFTIDNYGVWEFSSAQDCKKSERICKDSLDCGVLTKAEMQDGYTETTYPYNIDKVIAIYESLGGLRVH